MVLLETLPELRLKVFLGSEVLNGSRDDVILVEVSEGAHLL